MGERFSNGYRCAMPDPLPAEPSHKGAVPWDHWLAYHCRRYIRAGRGDRWRGGVELSLELHPGPAPKGDLVQIITVPLRLSKADAIALANDILRAAE